MQLILQINNYDDKKFFFPQFNLSLTLGKKNFRYIFPGCGRMKSPIWKANKNEIM